MAYTTKTVDLTGYNSKIENEGATSSGRLSATEFNTVVAAIIEAQNNITLMDTGVTLDLSGKQSTIQVDSVPTQGSTNLLSSGAIYTALNSVTDQDLNLVIDSAPAGGAIQAAVGNYYVFTTDVTALTITLPAPPSNTKVRGICFFFHTGTMTGMITATCADGASPVVWYDGFSSEDNTTYEINFVWNGWAWIGSYGIVTGLPAYPSAAEEEEEETT